MALRECSLKAGLPGSAANEKEWEKHVAEEPPIPHNTYALGQDPSMFPEVSIPSACCFKSLLSCSDCRGEVKFMAGQGPEATVLDS